MVIVVLAIFKEYKLQWHAAWDCFHTNHTPAGCLYHWPSLFPVVRPAIICKTKHLCNVPIKDVYRS